VAAVEALIDRWRRLRGSAERFHLDRPRFGFGSVRGANGLDRVFSCAQGANSGAANAAAKNDLARFGTLERPYWKELARFWEVLSV
jgi:hypothetical protein